MWKYVHTRYVALNLKAPPYCTHNLNIEYIHGGSYFSPKLHGGFDVPHNQLLFASPYIALASALRSEMEYRDCSPTTQTRRPGRSHSHHRHRHRHSGDNPDAYYTPETHPVTQYAAPKGTTLLSGISKGVSEQHSGHEDVWRWLSETGSREKHHWSDDGGSRNRIKENDHRAHRHHTTRPAQAWLPHGITPAANKPLPPLPLPSSHQRKSRRQRPMPTDSSIISGFQARRDPPGKRRAEDIAPAHSVASVKSTEELVSESPSPPNPDIVGSSQFEKRHRHRTREDKYDTSKRRTRNAQQSTKESGHMARQDPEKKKKKGIALGKHVMNNFTSEAVRKDRITV